MFKYLLFLAGPGEGEVAAAMAGEPVGDVDLEGLPLGDHFHQLIPVFGEGGLVLQSQKLVIISVFLVDHPFFDALDEAVPDRLEVLDGVFFGVEEEELVGVFGHTSGIPHSIYFNNNIIIITI